MQTEKRNWRLRLQMNHIIYLSGAITFYKRYFQEGRYSQTRADTHCKAGHQHVQIFLSKEAVPNAPVCPQLLDRCHLIACYIRH